MIKRRKPDEFTNHEDYGDPIADGIHHAIKPLDRIATEMEIKWGCERLPALVSPDTAAKFGQAKAQLDQAILDNELSTVTKKVSVLIRGWQALDAEASIRHQPLQPVIWSHTTQDGFKFAIAQGNAEAIKATREQPELEGVVVYSLDEIGRLLESDKLSLVNAVKIQFTGGCVSEVRKATSKQSNLDDPIPF